MCLSSHASTTYSKSVRSPACLWSDLDLDPDIILFCKILHMNFEKLVQDFGAQPFFDLASVVQLSGEARGTVLTQLHRWRRGGKILPLRRSMYTLADHYRRKPVNPAMLANSLYRPSYISGLWALGFYGLIPERVVTYTSVTTRVPRRFKNAFGHFEYRNVKQGFFFGYRVVVIQQDTVLLADPEKALVDLWHLGPGPWSAERISAMRFQNQDVVDTAKLTQYVETFDSPRLLRAADVWMDVTRTEQEGTVQL